MAILIKDANLANQSVGTEVISGSQAEWGVSPAVYVDETGVSRTVKRAFANVAASSTDASIVAAVASRRIRVLAAIFLCGATATTITFNTKPAGAGSPISIAFANDIFGGAVLPECDYGWFQSNVGEGLTVTTGAGSTTGVQVLYVESL